MAIVTPTSVLFCLEVVFTALKVLLLELNIEHVAGSWMIAFSFVMESLFGIALTVILVREQWTQLPVLVFGLLLITMTELFSVCTEGIIIRRKLTGIETTPTSRRGRVLRSVFKWLALMFGGAGAIIMEIIVLVVHHKAGFNKNIGLVHALVISVIFLIGCLATVTFTLLSCKFNSSSKFVKQRAFLALTVLFVAPLIAIVHVYVGIFRYRASSDGDFFVFRTSFDLEYSLIVGPLCTFLVAITALGVPNLKSEDDPDSSAVQLFEITAFGVCIPVLIISMNRIDVGASKLVILTLLPQSFAIVVPTVFPYITSMFKESTRMVEKV